LKSYEDIYKISISKDLKKEFLYDYVISSTKTFYLRIWQIVFEDENFLLFFKKSEVGTKIFRFDH